MWVSMSFGFYFTILHPKGLVFVKGFHVFGSKSLRDIISLCHHLLCLGIRKLSLTERVIDYFMTSFPKSYFYQIFLRFKLLVYFRFAQALAVTDSSKEFSLALGSCLFWC